MEYISFEHDSGHFSASSILTNVNSYTRRSTTKRQTNLFNHICVKIKGSQLHLFIAPSVYLKNWFSCAYLQRMVEQNLVAQHFSEFARLFVYAFFYCLLHVHLVALYIWKEWLIVTRYRNRPFFHVAHTCGWHFSDSTPEINPTSQAREKTCLNKIIPVLMVDYCQRDE